MTARLEDVRDIDAWAASEEAAYLRIQFQRLPRLLEGLPGASSMNASAYAGILGVSAARLAERLTMHRTRVSDASVTLAGTEDAATVRATLAGRRLVCYGDSITADRESWAEILASALAPDVTVLNRGRSGDTSGDLLNRFLPAVASTSPDLVVTMVGTNDGRRFRPIGAAEDELGPLIVSDADTRTNLAQMDVMIRAVTGRPGLWLTPPPVDEDRISGHLSTRAAGLVWQTTDLSQKVAIIEDLFPTRSARTSTGFNHAEGVERLLLPDGLHPNIDGQLALARVALALLASAV